MIAVLKIGSTQELVLIDDKKLYFAFSLNRSSILNDTYKYLKSLPKAVDELRVIITPTIIGSDLPCEGVALNQFDCGGIRKTAYLSKIDLDKLKLLALKLGLKEFKVYNMFEFLKLIGTKRPAIISGKYLDRNMYTVYVDGTGIKSFRESEKPNHEDIKDVQKISDTTTCISELNTELAACVKNEYININDMNDDEIKKLYMLLLTHYVTPTKVFSTESVIEQMAEPIQELVEEEEETTVAEEPPKPVEKRIVTKEMKVTYAFDALFVLLGIIVGSNAYANIQLKNENVVIHEKLDQLNSVLKPMKDNLNYYQDYVKVLEQGNTNDLAFIEKLNNIKIDGVLGEVVFKKNDVGVQVYLAKGNTDEETKAAIENYKTAVSEFMNITEVKEDTTANVTGATLVKIIIQGTLK